MANRSLLWIVLLLGSLSFANEWKTVRKEASSPNILFITIDTLRRDRLGCYGSVIPSTPNIDQLAKKSVVFESYYSAANCTTPSHLSIFSGKLPSTFGILDNEKHDLRQNKLLLLPSYLRKLGYKSHGVASVFFLKTNWMAGFGNQFDTFVGPTNSEFKANEVAKQFKLLLPELKKEKFFCWLHFYDPHAPYDPPDRFKKSFDAAASLGVSIPEEDVPMRWTKSYGLTRTWQARARYRGEVAYTDEQIGEILKLLKANSLDENTIIFIVADHGELLGEHHLFYTHASLYENTIHVPFIAYGQQFKPGRVQQSLSAIDIAPTILELAGGTTPDEMEGISAVPFLLGKRPNRDRLIYSIASEGVSIAVLKTPYKLVYNKPDADMDEEYELYNVFRDRFERKNEFYSNTKQRQAILVRANPYLFEPLQVSEGPSLSEVEIERLKSLGYLH